MDSSHPTGLDAEEPRIRYDWARVECPSCHAAPDTRCRALKSGRPTDAHKYRIHLGNRWRYEMRLADGDS